MQELYTKIPYVDKPVSRILYGTASVPFMMGKDMGELLDEVVALGIQTFDTARVYGASEKSIGNWVSSRGNREDIVLLSKCSHPSPFWRKRVNEKDMRKDLERSLRYLQTDYIDIYLLHRDDPDVPVGEIVEILNEMHKEGKIRAFGGSNWTHERIAEANAYAKVHDLIPFVVSSPNYSLAEQTGDPWGGGCVTITGKGAKEARAWYRETQMPMMAYSSLGSGFFSGKLKSDDFSQIGKLLGGAAAVYDCEENHERLRRCEKLAAEKGVTVAQLAMSWIFRQNINTFAIVSASSAARVQSNLDAMKLELSEAECKWLNLETEERR